VDKKWWTLIAVCTGIFMLLLDVTIVIVAQPAIETGLHAGLSDVQWTLDAYALTLAGLLLTSGVLADRYGRKLLFSIGLVIFTLGSLLCGLAVNPLMLIVSRSVQGVGGAAMFATSWQRSAGRGASARKTSWDGRARCCPPPKRSRRPRGVCAARSRASSRPSRRDGSARGPPFRGRGWASRSPAHAEA